MKDESADAADRQCGEHALEGAVPHIHIYCMSCFVS